MNQFPWQTHFLDEIEKEIQAAWLVSGLYQNSDPWNHILWLLQKARVSKSLQTRFIELEVWGHGLGMKLSTDMRLLSKSEEESPLNRWLQRAMSNPGHSTVIKTNTVLPLLGRSLSPWRDTHIHCATWSISSTPLLIGLVLTPRAWKGIWYSAWGRQGPGGRAQQAQP